MKYNPELMKKIEETKAEILKRFGLSGINPLLLNGRSKLVKENSRLNGLINIINTIYETDDLDRLRQFLEEVNDLEKEGKLDKIREIDVEKEVREEYVDEYNYTATRYDKLSDEELSRIDGIEVFYHNGNRVISLNGAPFRFLGRTIFGNTSVGVLTDPKSTGYMNSSLISNFRPNRWRDSNEFDILEGAMTSESFVAFGASDARATVSDTLVSPEILQRFVSSNIGTLYHTHIDLKGTKIASATLLELDSSLDLDDNPEYRPYGTIYVYNPKPYIEQATKRNSLLDEMSIEEATKHFNQTADTEFFLDTITSTTEYNELNGNINIRHTKKGKEVLSQLNKMVDFSTCDNIENLRYISSIIKLAEKLDVDKSFFSNIEKMCNIRIREISKTRSFSMRDEVEKCIEELDTRKEIEPLDIMRSFINSESKKSKEKGWFFEGESVEGELKRRDELNKDSQMQTGEKLIGIADVIRLRKQKIDKIYRTLELSDNQDNILEIASSINNLAKKVLELKKIKQSDSTELLESVSKIDTEDIFKMKTSLLKNDIGDKIDSLIKEAKIQKLDKNITMLGQRKKGLFDRFTGKEQYTESLINNLKAQKKLVNLGNEFGNHMGMRDLLEYAESNGMTPNIKKFLLGFKKCGFELSDEDNKKITELCERDDKSTNLEETSLVKKKSRKEYRKSANELEEETREINSQIERRQSNEYKFAESSGKIRLASGISNVLRQLKKIDEEFSKKMHIEKSVSRESDEREE